jgi:hypothetical protein
VLKDVNKTSQAMRTWLIFCSIVALLVVAPIVSTVQAQTPEPVVTSEEGPPVVQAEEEIPLPTEVPPPTPTPTPEPLPPTEIPTEIIVPTEVPTEVIVPTEIPTEVVVPTEAPTEVILSTQVVTPEPTTFPTPTPTVSPTPTKTVKTQVSILSVTPVSGTGGSCTQTSGSDVVPANGPVAFSCVANSGPAKLFITSVTLGWQYSLDNGASWFSETGTSTAETAAQGSGSASATFPVQIRPVSALPGSTGSVTIEVRDNPYTANKMRYTATLGATRSLEGAVFQMICSPTVLQVATSGVGTSDCTLSSSNISPSAQVSVAVSISMNPATGWTISPISASGSLTGASSIGFAVNLTPQCGAAVSPQSPNVFITSNLTFKNTQVPGPGTSITAKHNATATTVNASITGATMDWTRTYSLDPQSGTGSLTYRVEATQGCAGWNVQLSATDFVYSGPANGNNISKSNFAVTVTGAPTGTNLTGVGRPTTSGTLNTSLKLLNATEGNGIGTYNHAVSLGITIPGGARVGTYKSTVIISATSGP